MAVSNEHVKKAVESGYWSLYRYDPRLKEQSRNPFTLDSKEPSADFKEFLMSEVRYASLFRSFPEQADALFAKANADARDRVDNYIRMAKPW